MGNLFIYALGYLIRMELNEAVFHHNLGHKYGIEQQKLRTENYFSKYHYK